MTTPMQLPTHPSTGLQAVGVLPSGRPVWPVMGGNGEGGGTGTGTGSGSGGSGGSGSGEGGETGSGTGSGGNNGGEGGQSGQTFSQADVDRIVGERLARERSSKFGDYDDLKTKAAEFDKLRESQATEQEKAVTKARKEGEETVRGQLEPEMNRLRAALKHGLPDELGTRVLSAAKRLVGNTSDELEADAKEFFASSPIATGGASGGGGGFAQGVRGAGGTQKAGLAAGADMYRDRHASKSKTT